MKRCYLIAVLLVLFAAGAQAQVYWQSDFGPWGGRVNDLFEDAGGTLYAATMQGVYRSTDDGMSWRAFAFEGQRSQGFIQTRTGALLVSVSGEIWRSDDGGMHWDLMDFPEGNAPGFYFEHSSGILICEPWHYSWDDGRTWLLLPKPRFAPNEILTPGSIRLWSEESSDRILVHMAELTVPELRWIRNSWSLVDGKPGIVDRRFSLGGQRQLGWNPGNSLILSIDDGATWRTVWTGEVLLGNHDVPTAFSMAKNGHCLISKERGAVLYSLDEGEHWRETTGSPFAGDGLQDLLCTSRGALLAAGSTPGIFACNADDGSWMPSCHGMSRTPVSRVIQNAEGFVFAITPELRQLQTSNNLVDWDIRYGFETEIADLCQLRSGDLLAATRGEGVLRSTDQGRSWTEAHIGDRAVNRLRLLGDGRVLAGTGDGLSVSFDDGEQWTAVPSIPQPSVECLIERANGEIVFGGEQGVSIGNSSLNTWRGARFSWLPVMTLAENADGVLFAGTLDDGLHRSTDDGATWTQVGFAGEWITGIVTSGATNVIVATRRSGIHESRDGGLNWNPYGSGLRSEEILDLAAGPDGHLYVGTVRGLARSTYPVLTSKYLTPDFTLEQNTPNPATDVAVFGWSIPRAGHVRMSLYDVLGRELAVLLDGPAKPGLHWQSVDTRALVPGTYFCVLRFEGQLRDRKFQVVR